MYVNEFTTTNEQKITKQGSPPVRIFENPADDTTLHSEHF